MLGSKILQSANPKNPSSDKINNKKIEININRQFEVLGFWFQVFKTINQKHITINNNNNRTMNNEVKMSEL